MGTAHASMSLEGSARFEIVRCLGRGGMGVVYEAMDLERGERIALKTLRSMDAESLLRFKNEFRSLQDLHHPNLVNLGELLEEDSVWFFTMELVEGVDFLAHVQGAGSRRGSYEGSSTGETATQTATGMHPSELMAAELAREGPAAQTLPVERAPSPAMDEARLRPALAQLVSAVAALHAAGKVHRDIKPSNILVTPEGRVVLLDFGLITDVSARIQGEHEVVGTWAYMAPELALSPPGPPSDWYSVGTLLFEALTGTVPFDGQRASEIFRQKAAYDAPLPGAVVGNVPADLEQLCGELLARDPTSRPSGREVLTRLGAGHLAEETAPSGASLGAGVDFIGRRGELSMLQDAAHRAREEGAQVVLVHGEAGVGKSALVRHFLDETTRAAPSAVVLAGRCYERESVPYKAFDGVIDELSRFLKADPESARYLPRKAALLTQLFPVLQRVETISWGQRSRREAADPQELRSRAFAKLAELFARVARDRPLVLAIDDLQWADSDSLALLSEVLHGPEAPRLLLVATVREGARQSPGLYSVEELASKLPTSVRCLEVGTLSSEEAVELAGSLLREVAGPGGADAAGIAEETAGHPLFISELVRHIARFGVSEGPLQLHDALRARVRRLDGAPRQVIELLATAGVPLSQSLVSQALGLELGRLLRLLSPLRAESLVRSTGPRPADLVELFHDRVRDAVAAPVEPDRRRHYHLRLAQTLEATGSSDPERLALHWQGADDEQKAAAAYVEAASKAEQALAFHQASRFYEQALKLHPPDDPEVPVLQERLADALASCGHGAEAATWYLRSNPGQRPQKGMDLKLRAAEELLRCGRLDEGMAVLESILDHLAIRVPKTPYGALASLLLTRTKVRLRGLSFSERPEEEHAPAQLRRIDACWSVALSFGHVDPLRGADIQSRHMLLSLKAGEPYRVARSLGAEAIFVAMDGGSARKRAASLVRSAREIAERVGHPHALGMVEMGAGLSAYFVGEWRSALQGCTAAESLYRERCVGVAREQVTAQLFSLWALSYLGEIGEMSARASQWVRQAEARSDRYAATSMRLGFMNMEWLAKDEPERARQEIEVAMSPWSHEGGMQHLDTLIAQGHIDLYAGSPGAGYDRMVAAWPALVKALLLTVQVSRVEMRHLLGRCALATAQSGRDPARLLKTAAKQARRIKKEKMAWSTPLGQLLEAGVCAAGGRHEAALEAVTLALRGFEAADMGLYAAVSKRRRGQLLGGEEGAAQQAEAETFMVEQGVRDPERMAAMLAPGFMEDR